MHAFEVALGSLMAAPCLIVLTITRRNERRRRTYPPRRLQFDDRVQNRQLPGFPTL